MGHPSPTKGTSLGHRDYTRCCLALDFMGGAQISSETLMQRYYQGLSSESFHKTFKRDRQELEKEGLFLVEHKDGTQKRWSLDKERSLASIGDFDSVERRTVAILLRAYSNSPELGNTNNLGACIARIGQDSCAGLQQLPATKLLCKKDILQKVTESLALKKPLEIDYKSLRDERAVKRTLQPWGIFSLGKHVYVVGLRTLGGKTDAVRTLNLERIAKAKILKDEASYEIPSGFEVEDYRLMPFEIGAEDEQTAVFHVDKSSIDEVKNAVRQRGHLEVLPNGNARWTIAIYDTLAAAQWAVEVGVIPKAPEALVKAWRALNKEALNEN